MSKRILSLFLALCMLLLSVPVFVLSVFADGPAGETVTVTFNGAAPESRVNTATIKGASAYWPSGWSMGAMKTATTYSKFSMYTTAGGGIVCGWSNGSDNGDMWTNGGAYTNNYNNSWQYCLITTDASPDGLHLTSNYTGKLALDVKQLMNATAGNGLAIFHNGTMIWPNAETAGETANFADTTKWYVMDQAADYNYGTLNEESVAPSAMKFEGIDVTVGDAIDIACIRLNKETNGFTLHDLIVDATFSEITAHGPVYQTSFSGSQHFPGLVNEATWTVKDNLFAENDGWDLVSYALDHTDLKICNTIVNGAETESQGDGFWGCGTGLWATGTTVFRMVGNGTWGKTGAVSNASDRIGGARWTADRSGLIDVIIDDVSTINDPAWASTGAQVAVFVNGTKIWPAGDDWYVMEKGQSFSSATLEDTSALQNIILCKGQTVELLAKNLDGGDLGSGRGTNTYFTVSYDEILVEPEVKLDVVLTDKIDAKLVIKPGSFETYTLKVGYDTVRDTEGQVIMKDAAVTDNVCVLDRFAGTIYYELTGEFAGVTMHVSGSVVAPENALSTTMNGTTNTPYFDDEKNVHYVGGWDLACYVGKEYIGKGGDNRATLRVPEGSLGWPYAVLTTDALGPTGDQTFAFLLAGIEMYHQKNWGANDLHNPSEGAPALSLRARDGKVAAMRYTAPYAGKIDISLDGIEQKECIWLYNFGLAIFVDDKMVWPTEDMTEGLDDDGWYKLASSAEEEHLSVPAEVITALNNALKNIEVREGAEIVFACKGNGFSGDGNRWKNCGLYINNPTVTYHAESAVIPVVYNSIASVDGKIVEENPAAHANTSFAGASTYLTPKQFATAYPEQTEADAYFNYIKECGKFTYEGNWTAGVLSATTGAYEVINRWYFFAGMSMDNTLDSGITNGVAEATAWDSQWATTESAFLKDLEAFCKGERPSIWNCGGGALLIKTGLTAAQPCEGGTIVATAYTAPEAGTLKFSYNDGVLSDGALLAVAVDGSIVWPKGATLDNTSKWYHASAADTVADINALIDAALPDGVKVAAGAKVEFCIAKTAWLSATGYNGIMLDPAVTLTASTGNQHAVTYTDANGLPIARLFVDDGAPLPANPNTATLALGYDIDGDGEPDELPLTVTEDITLVPIGDLSTPDSFANHTPVVTAENTCTGENGNWKAIHGHWDDDIATADNATWSYEATGIMNVVDVPAEKIIISSEAGLWAANGGGLYTGSNKFAVRLTSSLVGNAALYTAPATGVLAIDFAQLVSNRQVNSDSPAGVCSTYLAITLNGKIVWPSNGKPYKYEGTTVYEVGTNHTEDMLAAAREYEEFPTLTVCAGDEIAFIGNMGNDTTWMFNMVPVVHYTARLEEPAIISATPVLGDVFSIKFLVKADALATGKGVIVNGVKYAADADGYATVTGIAAKQMTDALEVKAYAEIGENTMESTAREFTFAQVVKALIEDEGTTDAVKNLAKATLHYGAAVQTYLNYYTARLANEGVEAPTAAGNVTNVYALSDELGDDAEATINSVSVIMGDKIGLKFVCFTDSAFKLQISKNADFSDATEIAFTHCGLGSKANEFKAIFSGIGFEDWNTTYYIRVIDADGVNMSEALTYSVLSYTSRIANDELKAAMQNLWAAVNVYNA